MAKFAELFIDLLRKYGPLFLSLPFIIIGIVYALLLFIF